MRRVVGLVDYGAGNLRSLTNAFEHLGARVALIGSPADLDECTHLVLPGVGAFGYCADRLRESGLTQAIHGWAVENDRPFLGICVGMQLLALASEESPDIEGLGWLGGCVQRLSANDLVRIPHVGWNTVEFDRDLGSFHQGDRLDFYFDHSFALGISESVHRIAACQHGDVFSAVVARGNVVAAQFHPEKSQEAGLRFLKGFLQEWQSRA